MLVYSGEDLMPLGYTDSDFHSDRDSRKSISGSVFTFGGGVIVWRSIKQSCIVDSTMEAEYVAASEASKEVVWLHKFLSGLEVIPGMDRPITLYCENTAAIANIKDSRHHKRSKHNDRNYHIIRGFVESGDVAVVKLAPEDNLADPFTKTLVARSFKGILRA